jgi:predicted XRE-type DNA-binding protein
MISESVEKRFWEKVNKTETCWLWTSAMSSRGYGHFWLNESKRAIRAHRLSWIMHYGTIPKGIFVCHHCDVNQCVRPDHLFLGTHEANMKDMVIKKRSARRFREDNQNCKLTKKQFSEITNLLKTSKRTQKSIAEQFKVSRALICLIKNDKYYRKPKY